MAKISARSEDDVVAAVAAARDGKRTLEIVGAGTKRGFGRPVVADDVLDLSQLSGILNYEPEELVITARAGTLVAEIEAALAEKNQRLGFEPADWAALYGAPSGLHTIGGALSADASGPASVRYGRARDQLLGYRAVNGFAKAYRAGGRVVKNVTGFDLAKLMCGALGTLGALTEVTLRVFPRTAEESWVIAVADVEECFAILRRIWSSPLEATGLCIMPLLGIAVRMEGAASALAAKRSMLRALAGGRKLEAASANLFCSIRDLYGMSEAMLDVWRMHVPPASAPVAFRMLDARSADCAGGVIYALGTRDARNVHEIAALVGGHAVLMRSSKETRTAVPVFSPLPPHLAALTRSVKAAFDPLHLFNPGRMFEGV